MESIKREFAVEILSEDNFGLYGVIIRNFD